MALYDREQAGVRRTRVRSTEVSADPAEPWVLLGTRGELISNHDTAEAYCAALRRAIDHAVLPKNVKGLWYYNEPTIQRLRMVHPELKTAKGAHYADVLTRYSERARHRLAQARSAPTSPSALVPSAPIDKSALLLAAPKRQRDPDHLRFVATQPCLICGRAPVHAHHLRFAQPRSMGNKVSDEWAVPLCFTHHRALHTVGNEETWWEEKGIDAKAEALKLWRASHGGGEGDGSEPEGEPVTIEQAAEAAPAAESAVDVSPPANPLTVAAE